MPRVPRIREERLREAPLPAAPAAVVPPIEAFGAPGDITREAQALQADTAKFAQIEKAKAQRFALTGLERKLLQNANELRIEQERFQGELAIENVDFSVARHDEFWDGLRATLGDDPDLLRAGEQLWLLGRDKLNNFSVRHADQQRDVLAKDNFEGLQEQMLLEASASVDDLDVIDELIERGIALIADRVNDQGLSPEVFETEAVNFRSRIHTIVINGLNAAGQDLDAQEYFKANKNEIRAQDRPTVERNVTLGSLRGEAQRLTDLILSEAEEVERARGSAAGPDVVASRKVMLERARTDAPTPELRDRVVNRLKQRFAEEDQFARDDSNRIYEEAAGIVDATGDVEAIPPDQWDRLSVRAQDALKRRIVPPANDDRLFLEFNDLFATDPDAIAQMTTEEFDTRFVSHFDKSSRAKAITMRVAAIEDFRKAPKEETGFRIRTKRTIVMDEMRRAGIIVEEGVRQSNTEKTESGRRRRQFEQEFDRRLELFEASAGREATREELKDIAEQMTVPLKLSQSFLGLDFLNPDDPVLQFELLPEDRSIAFVESVAAIPALAMEQMRADMAAVGKVLTEDKAVRLYNAFYLGDNVEAYQAILDEED